MVIALLPLLGLVDGAPGLTRTKAAVREHDCERMSVETAERRYPGQVPPVRPRGEYLERGAVVCRERLLSGVRDARDEAILATLEARASELSEVVGALRPDLAGHTWLVEAHHPSVAVNGKIAFATKNALVRRGLVVSDRTPALGAGDIDVLTRMPPADAYPAACQRMSDGGMLKDTDVLLAVVLLDPRETALHAGLCAQGRWTWLR